MQVVSARDYLSKQVSSFVQSNSDGNADNLKNFNHFDAFIKSGNIGITLSDDDTIKAYCEFIVSSGMDPCVEASGYFERVADAIVKTIENGSTLISLGSRK